MGQEASKPQPGKKLQVIGAGLSRTGTTSFSKAVSILLDGPAYHCGTQLCRGDSHDIKTWTKILQHTPIRNAEDEAFVLRELSQLMDGFVTVTDIPAFTFVPELMKLYPDAKVICTVRDPDQWVKSGVNSLGLFRAMPLLFSWLFMFNYPMRHWEAFRKAAMNGRLGESFPENKKNGGPTGFLDWDKHIQFLKDNVPAEKLVFFDVRDGWEPLCQALGCEVPKGISFPRLNDSKALKEALNSEIWEGIRRWTILLGTITAVYLSWRLYL